MAVLRPAATFDAACPDHHRVHEGAVVNRKRDPMFAMSDISLAAGDFIAAISEHAPTIWEPDLEEALADSLIDRAFAVLQGGGEVDFS